MIRIAICCGEGFASGFLAKNLNEKLAKENLQDRAVFKFIPFIELWDRQDEVDIAMLLPHVEHMAKHDGKAWRIPLYVIPYKVSAMVKAEGYVEDAEDILKLPEKPVGIYHFPDEPHPHIVNRMVSHQDWLAEQEEEKEKKEKKEGF